MADLSTSRFEPTANRGVDIGDLISAPLVAAATANSRMAREQVRFLMDFCFAKSPEEKHYTPVVIRMRLTQGFLEPPAQAGENPTMRSVTTEFQLPLLTLIAINSLAVETVKVDFEMEVTTHSSGPEKRGEEGASTAQLVGKISYDSNERASRPGEVKRESRNNSSLKVNVTAGQLPLPRGVTFMLDMYVKSAHPLPAGQAGGGQPFTP